MDKKQLILLDSLPSKRKVELRKRQVKRVVDTASRMRLAIDLIMGDYNILKEEIVLKACNRWNNMMDERKLELKI
ncbi:Ulp1 protease family, carboxy-terminal domain protein [Sesbania bispinosa]|nr:Ulp1 protease family, carboxy-terminal domain protein [Sesbania bispinosa]